MADISAEAFMDHNDPIGNFIFGDEPNRRVLSKRFFRALVTSCSPKVLRLATSPEMEAISIWFPPGLGHEDDVDADPFKPEDFTQPDTLKKMQAVSDVITALTAELGHEPQWYLHLLAVRTKCSDKGHCSALLEPVFARAKAEGLPCTLITQSMQNALKYGHWGFRVIKEMTVPDSRETFYSMRRD